MRGPREIGFWKGGETNDTPPQEKEISFPAGSASQGDMPLENLPLEQNLPLENRMPFSGGIFGSRWGRFPRLRGPRWVWWTIAVGAIVVWGFADVRLRGLPWPDRPLEHKTDFTVYTVAGRAFFTGENPYEVSNPRGWKYLYPPLFALLVAPLSLLPMAEQCLVWYFLSVVFCWGCYREWNKILQGFRNQEPSLARVPSEWWTQLGILAIAAALLPTLNCLQRGQVGVLKLYLLLLGVRLVWQSASWRGQSLGGLALAGAIVLKLTPALAVGMLLWAQLAALLTGLGQKKKESKPRAESAPPAKSVLQAPHFAYIRKQRGPKSLDWRLPSSSASSLEQQEESPSPSFQTQFSEETSLTRSHPGDSPRSASEQASPRVVKTNEQPLREKSSLPASSRQMLPLPTSRETLRAFWATSFGLAGGLLLFFFLLPAALIGWQKNLEHLSYWAVRMGSFAEEGLPVRNEVPEVSSNPEALDRSASAPSVGNPQANPRGQEESPRRLPANSRTVRNQSLANALFRLAAFVDYQFFGGPEDRGLDLEAASPNRIDTPVYHAIQKTARLILLAAILLAGGLVGAWGGRLGQATAFALGCVGILVISPVAWGHYFMLLVPGVLFVPLWFLERGAWRMAGWLAMLPALLSVLHYAFVTHLGRVGLLGLGTAGWLLTSCLGILVISLKTLRSRRAWEADQARTRPAVSDPQVEAGSLSASGPGQTTSVSTEFSS